MITIVADDHIPFLKGALEPFAHVNYLAGDRITRSDLLDADGLIIRTRTRCTRDLLEGTHIRFIATATIGYDHIDTNYCEATGIIWNHAPGCNSSSVKQYVASALGQIAIKLKRPLAGQTIGIIGAGHVGSKVARLAHQLGMIVLINDPPRARTEGMQGFNALDEILRESDIITFHVPLEREGVDKTHHLADISLIDQLKRKPLLINTSRGEVADTPAIRYALEEHKISGYISDVWENEPKIDLELMHKSLIATPHIAGYSVEGKANGTAACVRAASRHFGFGIDEWFPRDLPKPVNPDVTIYTAGKTNEEITLEAFNCSYNIMQDDASFRNNPASFEKLRNFYPIRREFEAYRVLLKGPRPTLGETLEEMGFEIR